MNTTTTPARRVVRISGGDRLRWYCDECGHEVANGSGYVTIDGRAAWARLRAKNQMRSAREVVPGETPAQAVRRRVTFTNLSAVLTLEDEHPRPLWHALHAACDPQPDSLDYWLAVESISTLPQVLNWTAHLMGKEWVSETDWRDLINRIAEVDA